MTSFMGPMAPPPPAQPQPQALDIRTDPNQRQQFKQFMRQRMMPMTSAPIAQPPMMPMMQSPAMFNMGGGVDIFDPMYSAPMMAPPAPMGFNKGGSIDLVEKTHKDGRKALYTNNGSTFVRFVKEDEKPPLLSFAKFKETLGFDDGGAVPPRRADIQGQDHMLSYITPDEADILKALGGSGEAGPMGIPAFPPGFGDDPSGFGSERSGGAAGGPSGAGSGSSGGDSGAGDGGDTYSDMGMSPGRSQAQFGTTEFAGKSEQEAQDIVDSGGGSDEAQAVQQSIATQQRADAQRAAEQAERQRIDQIVRDAVSGSASARQNLIDQRSPQVQAEIDELRSDPANLGPAGQLLADIRSAPTTDNVPLAGIASTVTGLRDTRGPDAGRLDLLDIDNLLTDQFTERGLVTDAGPSSVSSAGTLGQADAYKSGLDMRSDERTMNPADFEAQYGFSPRGVTGNVLSETPPSVSTTTTTPTGTTTTTSAPIGMDDEYDDVVGTPDYDDPNREGYSAGLPTGLDFIDTPQGRFTTNLAGTTAAQRAAMPGYMNTRNEDGSLRGGIAGLVDPIFGNPVSSVYGYEIPDLATGQITGFTGPSNLPGLLGQGVSGLQDFIMGPPKTTEDLLQRGVYTGFGPGSQIGMEEGGEDRPVKAPTDPCPDGFIMKNGACTPIDSGAGDGNPPGIGGIGTGQPPPPPPRVIVPSPRQPVQTNLQGPVGYGMPTAGQINPFAVSSAGLYQQMLNQQAANPPQFMPIRFQQGGPVSSNLDRAADNFLKALMPAA